MAFSKRTIIQEITIRFNEAGAFELAERIGKVQVLEDGVVIAERLKTPDSLSLAQVKTAVAAL